MYESSVSYGVTSNFDTENFLRTGNLETIKKKFIKARETTQRVDVNVAKEDRDRTMTLYWLSQALNDTFDRIQGSLGVLSTILNVEFQMLGRRIDFHDDRGMRAVKFIIEHDFLRGWEVMEERAINHMTTGFYETSDAVDNIIRRMNSSDLEDAERRVLYLMIEQDLQAMQKQAERALANITQTYNAYKTGEPLLTYKLTYNRRYDMNYIPKSLLSYKFHKQTDHYYELTNDTHEFIDSIVELRRVALFMLKNKVLDNQTEVDYHAAQTAFIKACKGYNYRRFMYKDRVVMKPLELMEERITQFRNLNESLYSKYKDLTRIMDSITSQIELTKYNTWSKLQDLVMQACIYTQDGTKTKVSLANNLTDHMVYEATGKLGLFFSEIRDRSREMDDALKQLKEAFIEMWSNMLTEITTKEIYSVIRKDVDDLVDQPSNRTFYVKIFAHLLRVKRSELKHASAESFYWRLNADFPNTTVADKVEEYNDKFDRIKINSDIQSLLKDRDQEFLKAFQEMQHSLQTFLDGNKVNYDFVK